MDILKVFETGRKHWVLLLFGGFIGAILAFSTTFHFVRTPENSRHLEFRSEVVYETKMSLMIAEPHWDIGRSAAAYPDGFNKASWVAPTYAQLMTSDKVKRIAEDAIGPLRARVSAKSNKDTPILTLTVQGSDSDRTAEVARAMADAFIVYMTNQQEERDVPQSDRMEIEVLAGPQTPAPRPSGVLQQATLALLAPIVAFLGIAIAVDNARSRRLVV